MLNLPYENELVGHMHFHMPWFCKWTHFDAEAERKSEMAYCVRSRAVIKF